MEISAKKTKLVTNNTSGTNTEIKVNGQKLKTVTSFKYLGSAKTDEGSKPEILCSIAQTTAALTRMKPVWNDRSISLSSKIRLMHSLVTSIFLYACESWTLTAELQRRIQAMEMTCYHKTLCISYKAHVTNKEVGAKNQNNEDLLTIVRDANCSGMVMSPIHQVWPKPSCKAQWKGEEDKADRGRGGKTTSGNGQAWSSPSPRGQWRTGKNGIICVAPDDPCG